MHSKNRFKQTSLNKIIGIFPRVLDATTPAWSPNSSKNRKTSNVTRLFAGFWREVSHAWLVAVTARVEKPSRHRPSDNELDGGIKVICTGGDSGIRKQNRKYKSIQLIGMTVLVFRSTAKGESIFQPKAESSQIEFSIQERQTLEKMHISKAKPFPPPNPFLSDPNLGNLGKQIFFDNTMSASGKISCASCHAPESGWTGGDMAETSRIKNDKDPPSLSFSPYHRFLNWDGSSDSIFAQSIAPLLNEKEHGLSEKLLTQKVTTSPIYNSSWKVYKKKACKLTKSDAKQNSKWCHLNATQFVGLALETFLFANTVTPGAFDFFIESLRPNSLNKKDEIFSKSAQLGLKIFLGKGNCTQCHYGPLLTDGEFHSVGAPNLSDDADQRGRVVGVHKLLSSAYNCLGRPSFPSRNCTDLGTIPENRVDQVGAYRTPSLRNVSLTSPYFHSGAVRDLAAVVRHYSFAVTYTMGEPGIIPLNLNDLEKSALVDFLSTFKSGTLNKYVFAK